MPDVLLTVGGRRYAGWQTVRIRRGIEQIAGAFELTVSERWPGRKTPWPIRPGDACTMAADGTTVITGHVDDVLPGFDATSHSLRVTGRDATGELVDCSAVHPSGTWEARTLLQIAGELCQPFGIPVSGPDGKPFRRFSLQQGETVHEAIERLCRFRGLLPVSDGQGGLVLTTAGTERVPVRLVQDENILAASGRLSNRDRFSRYTVKGQMSGDDFTEPEQHAAPSATVDDPGVMRYRPLIVIAEGPGDSGQLKDRARWEAAVRRGRSSLVALTVQGWSHPGGLWQPNTRVIVTSPWLQMDAEMLIVAVTLVLDEQGTRTELEVCKPEAFKRLALPEPDGGDDLW